jgi:hypothetical protein
MSSLGVMGGAALGISGGALNVATGVLVSTGATLAGVLGVSTGSGAFEALSPQPRESNGSTQNESWADDAKGKRDIAAR